MSPERLEPEVSAAPPAVAPALSWRVHLLRRRPRQLPIVFLTLALAFVAVWLVFGNPLPALVADLLLIGSISEYLFPIAYSLTAEGVAADAPATRLRMDWKDARRLIMAPNGVTLSPFAAPSRLDAFRGVTLRFAPKGEPGDRASVLAAVARYAPTLLNADSPADAHAEVNA